MKLLKTIANVILWMILVIPVMIFLKLFAIAEMLRHKRSKRFYSKLYDHEN